MATATGTLQNSGDAVACPSLQAVAVTLVGSGLSGTVAFEALAADGATWLPVLLTRQDTAAQATTAALAGAVAQVWSGNTFGTQSFRVRATTALGAPLSVWLASSASFFRLSGGSSAAPTTVLPPAVSGLYAWYEGDAGCYQDAGVTPCVDAATIQQWNDLSGNGRHLTQATAGKRPTYKTNVLNGLPATRWAGAQCLQGASFAVGTFAALFVFKGTAAGVVYELSGATGVATPGFYLYTSSNDTVTVYKGGTGTIRNATSGWGTNGQYQVWGHYFNGFHSGHKLCAAQFDTNLAPGTATGDPGTGTTTDTFNVGSRNNATSLPFSGDICELILYTPAPAMKDFRNVVQYLQNKWNL